MYGLICGSIYGQMHGQICGPHLNMHLYLSVHPTRRGLRGNQDGEAVGRWHTAAVAYCRLRAPAADQCLKKKNQLTRTQEPSPRADSSWHLDPLYRTEAGARCCEVSPGPSLGPPALGTTKQEVATSVLCECGSGSPRMRDLRGPCLM